ncbi:MAG: septation protein A [Rhodocyclaceae bacterium]|nr:septation protein A [Rhodocyclaceae bacterium]
MKFLFDLLPVILFFVAYKAYDIYVATTVAIVSTCAQIAWIKWRHGRVDKMLIASGVLVVVFGGMTLFLHDPTFIKWKPTILYWLFAAVLAGAALMRRNLMRTMLAEQIELPDALWRRLNFSWIVFFAFMGAANLYVAYGFSEEAWVNFKLFGGMGLMLVFVLLQGVVISRHLPTEKESR